MLKNPGIGSKLKVFIDNALYPKWTKSSLDVPDLDDLFQILSTLEVFEPCLLDCFPFFRMLLLVIEIS
jgi:hypothetical protein